MSKPTTPPKKTTSAGLGGPVADTKTQIAVYLPNTLRARLARYLYEKHPMSQNMRNTIVCNAIDEKLTREGF